MTGRRIQSGIKYSNQKLNGRTLFVMDDIESTHYLIVDSDAGVHVVDASGDGLKKIELRSVDVTSFLSELALTDVETEALDNDSDNIESIQQAINLGRIALAANTLGAAQHMLDRYVDYAKERKQFGRQIGSFQAVKHMCPQMASD